MTRIVRLPGLQPYAKVHALQRHLLQARIERTIPDTILLLEHAPTITVGRARGAMANVLRPGTTPVVEVERGGDVTWHGPGQLVAYPIVDLRGRREDLHAHLRSLEQAVIALLADLGLEGRRDPRNTGVWLPTHGENRKVCSVGIAARRWVSWHGLALNVDPDLGAFQQIHPCGFRPSIMTRLADHRPGVRLEDLVEPLAAHLTDALDLPPGPVERLEPDALLR